MYKKIKTFNKTEEDGLEVITGPMGVITTLYEGDDQPDYKIYPSIYASKSWFDNFDTLLYNRVKYVKTMI